MKNLKKVLSLALLLVVLTGVLPVAAGASEKSGNTVNQSLYYGRSTLAKLDNAAVLLYAYDRIAEGVENAQNSISVYDGSHPISQKELEMVMDAYYRDYAHHFWVKNSYNYSASSHTAYSVSPHYLMTGAELNTAKAVFEAAVAQALSGITASMSDFEKELYLHDYLAGRVEYVSATNAHNAYGALVEGLAVCEGYAEAFQYLLQRAGIQSFIMEGSSRNRLHAWNAVNIGGKFYHVDLTWDDQESDLYHAYFNLTDTRLQEDHVIFGADYEQPVCNSEAAFYFTVMGGCLDTYDVATVAGLLKEGGYKAQVYIPGSLETFWNWFCDNCVEIVEEAGITGGFYYSCRYLGNEMILYIDCMHSYRTPIAAKAPDCENPGNNLYYICECGVVMKADGVTETTAEEETLPALGHDMVGAICQRDGCDYSEIDTNLGTLENPEILIPGNERTVEVGGYDSYYFQWTAPEDGVLTMDVSVFRTMVYANSNGLDHDNTDTADKNYVTNTSPSSDTVIWDVAKGETVCIELYTPSSYPGTGTIGIAFEAREHSEGSMIKPIEIVDQDRNTIPVAEFTVTVPAGRKYWFDISNVQYSILNVEAADGIRYTTHGGGWYGDEDGNISIMIDNRASLEIENTTGADYTANLQFEYEPGTNKNPMALELGTTEFYIAPFAPYGRYYTWTAPGDGTFTFRIASEALWQYRISSQDEVGVLHTAEDVPCMDTESREVKAGDRLMIHVIGYGYLPDLVVGIPAGFTVTTSFEEAECPHTETTVLDAVAPDCTNTGLTEGKKCVSCGKILVAQTILPANGHTEIIDEEVAPSCSAAGLTEGKHCDVCGDILVAQTVVDKLAHTEAVVPAVEPNCVNSGLTEGKKCSVCGEILVAQETVSALGHTPETVAAADPTCTATGLTEGQKCSVCGTTLTAQTVIPALGHSPETVSGYGATCTADGLTDGEKCSVCGVVTEEQTTIPAMGHAWNNGVCGTCNAVCDHSYGEDGECTVCGGSCVHSYDAEETAPNCTEQGYITYTCGLCGSSYIGDYVEARGHNWVDATCTAPKTCSVCGALDGEPNGHHYEDKVMAPTCTEQGYTNHTCHCGYSYADGYVDALGHTPGVPVEENKIAPTCTEQGSYEKVVSCSRCDVNMSSELQLIPALGHTPGEAVTENEKAADCIHEGSYDAVVFCDVCHTELSREKKTVPANGIHTEVVDFAVAPTCTEDGLTEGKHCSVCGTVTVARKTDPAKGHTPGQGKVENGEEVVCCSRCGLELSRKPVSAAVGDMDHDGVVDQHDASLVFVYFLKDGRLTEENKHCDMDGNGMIDQHDASLIFEYFLTGVLNVR